MPYKDYQKAKKYAREYNRKHKKEKAEYSRLWRKKNPEKAKAIDRKSKEKHREERNKKKKKPKYLFKQYQIGAKQRGYKWELTFGQFMTLWQKPCYYCKKPIETVGLDRVENDGGYVITNLVPCCWICNQMKKARGKNEFISHCIKIAQIHSKSI